MKMIFLALIIGVVTIPAILALNLSIPQKAALAAIVAGGSSSLA